jgi:hypothetical protein
VGEEKTVLISEKVDKCAQHLISWYGFKNQLQKAAEESKEYESALDDLIVLPLIDCVVCEKKCDEFREAVESLIDETADAIFTAYQVAKMIGLEKVIERIEYKANRAVERINA